MTSDSPQSREKRESVIEARVFKPILDEYAKDEIPALPHSEQIYARNGAMKVVGSEDLGTIIPTDRNELKEKIKELLERHYPVPLLVKLNTTLDNTYIFDMRFRRRDPDAVEEVVYFSYDELGKNMRKFFEEGFRAVDKEIEQALAKYGWTMGDFFSAIYAGIPANKITREELKANLQRLSPYEQDAIQKIRDVQRAGLNRIAEDIFREFGVRVKTTFSEKEEDESRQNAEKRWLRSVYNTTAERKKRNEIEAGMLMHPLSYRNRYRVKEAGRMIGKRSTRQVLGDPIDYFRKFHPEMITTISGADTNMLADNEREQDYVL